MTNSEPLTIPDGPTEEWRLCPYAANAVGVGETLLRQWVQARKVTSARTASGQRLVYMPDLQAFVIARRELRMAER